MKVEKLKENLSNYVKDEDYIFAAIYDKDDGNDFLNPDGDEEYPQLTSEEWEFIVEKMEQDESVWQEIHGALRYYASVVLQQRERAKEDDDSVGTHQSSNINTEEQQ